ncbi:MAG: hypothetical protein PHX34_03580 [Candidatus Shapirobacteria bacterium]|nr:hypothetical protein [Candidatus Shapirobacteria bacterium]
MEVYRHNLVNQKSYIDIPKFLGELTKRFGHQYQSLPLPKIEQDSHLSSLSIRQTYIEERDSAGNLISIGDRFQENTLHLCGVNSENPKLSANSSYERLLVKEGPHFDGTLFYVKKKGFLKKTNEPIFLFMPRIQSGQAEIDTPAKGFLGKDYSLEKKDYDQDQDFFSMSEKQIADIAVSKIRQKISPDVDVTGYFSLGHLDIVNTTYNDPNPNKWTFAFLTHRSSFNNYVDSNTGNIVPAQELNHFNLDKVKINPQSGLLNLIIEFDSDSFSQLLTDIKVRRSLTPLMPTIKAREIIKNPKKYQLTNL